MDLKEAQKQKTFIAEKQVSYVRLVVILFGTITYFFLNNEFVHQRLANALLIIIWLYGLYIPIFKPYERYPIFLASWFTYIGDAIFATLWLYATGGFYSPYHVMFYTSIIAVSFRFNFKITLLTSTLYTICYFVLLYYLDQLSGNETLAAVRTGFIFIIGLMTYLITKETLFQTQQKVTMERLVKEAANSYEQLKEKQLELKELNNKLQLRNDIFNHAEENALIGSYSWHLSANKLEYSDNLYKILGYKPGEFEPSFEKFLNFLHPEDKENMIAIWESAKVTKKFETSRQRVLTKDGQLKYLNATGKFTGSGVNELVIGTIQDITGDVLLNEMLKEKNSELERSNTELASFTYIASHDLQEPVRKIHTFSKLILEKDGAQLPETTRNYLSRISSSAVRMQNLIEAFLNYSRIDNSQLVFEKTDLTLIIEDAISQLSDLIEEKNVVIENGKLPVLSVIPFQVQQLFINLISNAIKYSRKDISPLIKITSEIIPGKKLNEPEINPDINYWKISVEDNGIGFEQKYADKIFEVFKRLHNKEDYAGTGIGLAICKKIMVSHKGMITATGKPNKGAVFSVYFPAA